jgi:hypothetical protein
MNDVLVRGRANRATRPPVVHPTDKSVFLISIYINPNMPSASKDKKLSRTVTSQSYLLEGMK